MSLSIEQNRNPEFYAQQVLNDCRINNIPVNLTKIVRRLDITLDEVKLSPEHFGLAIPEHYLVVLNTEAKYLTPGQRRFTLAHEIGHIVMGHRGEDAYISSTADPIVKFQSKLEDKEADKFATALLMPEDAINDCLRDKDISMDAVRYISDYFQVSLSSSAYRYMDFCPEKAMIVFSKDSKIRSLYLSKEMFFEVKNKGYLAVDKGSFLGKGSIAKDFFMNRLHSKEHKRNINLSVWFSGIAPDEYRCYEEVLISQRNGWVLSLVWLEYLKVNTFGLPDDFVLL